MKFRISKREEGENVFYCGRNDWKTDDFAAEHMLFSTADSAEMYLTRARFYHRGDHVYLIAPLEQ